MSKHHNKTHYFALFLVFVLATFLRIYHLPQNPPGFFADEASIGYNAYRIGQTGRDEHNQAWPVLFKAFGEYKFPVFIYSAVPLIKIGGLHETTVRLTAVLYGLLAILASYLLAREIISREIGLLTALFLAITPWHVHLSRVAFGLIASTAWVPLTFYFLTRARQEPRWLAAAFPSLAVSLLTYGAVWLYLPLLVFGFALAYHQEVLGWLKKKEFWIYGGITLIIFLALIGPTIIKGTFFARWHTVQNNSRNLPQFLDTHLEHFSFRYLFLHGEAGYPRHQLLRHSIPGIGQLYFFQLPLILLGITYLARNHRSYKHAIFFLGAWLFVYPLPSVLTHTIPIATRSIIGVIPFQILTASGLFQLVRFLQKKNHSLLNSVVGGTTLLIMLLETSRFAQLLFNVYPLQTAGFWGWQYGPRPIIDYFNQVREEYDQLIISDSFNGTGIFLKFYAPKNYDNYRVGGLEFYQPSTKQLFALPPSDFDSQYSYRRFKQIYYPNGQLAFEIREIIN